MQDRLAQQQKATAEERAHLKEIISRMDAQLSEQQRQLEKVRVKSDCFSDGCTCFDIKYSTSAYISKAFGAL